MYNFRQKMLAAPAIIKNNTTIENDLTTKSIDYRTASQRYQNDESMFASRSSSIGGAGGGGGNKSTSRKNISCEILKRK
jgi:hypothetical protein